MRNGRKGEVEEDRWWLGSQKTIETSEMNSNENQYWPMNFEWGPPIFECIYWFKFYFKQYNSILVDNLSLSSSSEPTIFSNMNPQKQKKKNKNVWRKNHQTISLNWAGAVEENVGMENGAMVEKMRWQWQCIPTGWCESAKRKNLLRVRMAGEQNGLAFEMRVLVAVFVTYSHARTSKLNFAIVVSEY